MDPKSRPTFKGIPLVYDQDLPQKNTLYIMTEAQEALFRRIVDAEYGPGTFTAYPLKGDSH